MNWLGVTRATLVAILVGAVLGALAYGQLLLQGWDVPFVVGVLVVGAVLAASRERNGMRGLTASCATFWGIVLGQRVSPLYGAQPILHFHATLGWGRVVAICFTLAMTYVLSGMSLRALREGPGAAKASEPSA